MILKGFQRPKRLEVDRSTLTSTYGRFTAQPFERGFGLTIGNALRRILLSATEGAAITAVRIEGVLHEFSSIPGVVEDTTDIILNLNEPCAIGDTSWIKPGKVIREVTLTTTGGKACVDFAVEHNLQYVEFDAGWYGLEYSDESDATTVTVDPKRSKGPLDLPEVIRYAA